jgi:hypothetical protein
MKEISDKLYHQLKRLGVIDADTRSHNVGASDYSKRLFQPWTAWIEYNLNAFDADILKRVLRTKEGEDRITDYEKIIHICQERIRQLKFEKEPIPVDSVRDEDRQIRKGDVFECIQHVVMEDGEVLYRKGKAYASERDGCITNEEHDECHHWDIQESEEDNWWHYFKRI